MKKWSIAHFGSMTVTKGDVEARIIAYLNTPGVDTLRTIHYVEMTFNDGSTRFARLISGTQWEWADVPFI